MVREPNTILNAAGQAIVDLLSACSEKIAFSAPLPLQRGVLQLEEPCACNLPAYEAALLEERISMLILEVRAAPAVYNCCWYLL